jgi:hypothetical protein
VKCSKRISLAPADSCVDSISHPSPISQPEKRSMSLKERVEISRVGFGWVPLVVETLCLFSVAYSCHQ